jgi:hypothetical protein
MKNQFAFFFRSSVLAPGLSATLFVLAGLWFVRIGAYSANDLSRLAAITALVERGTWAIDGTAFGTVDQIKVGDHFYSDKPPIMALLGAGVYAAAYHGFGLRLNPEVCDPGHHPGHCRALADPPRADWAYVILTLVLVTSSGGLCVWLACAYALRHGWPWWGAALGALVLGLGTGLWAYSTTFVNHVPAALGVMGSAYFLLTQPDRKNLLLSGALMAFSAALDLSCGVYGLAFALYAAARFRRQAGWWALGSLPVIALAVWLNYQIVGNPFPPQMYTQGYEYSGSFFQGAVAGNQRAEDVGRYAFDMFVGQRGLLAHFPIVLALGAAPMRALVTRDSAVRGLAWAVAGGTALYLAYFVFYTDNFGGYAYSPRWLLVPIPTLALFAAHWPEMWRTPARVIVLGAFAVLSVAGGYAGAQDVWHPDWPLFRLADSRAVNSPIVNVALRFGNFYQVPDHLRPGLAPNTVRQYVFEPGTALVVQSEPAWWFIHPDTPLAPELVQALNVQLDGDNVLYANLRPRADVWVSTLDTAITKGIPPTPAQLPEIFNQEIWLLGYERQLNNDTLSVITAWRMENPPPYAARRAVFLHLVNAAGQIVRQQDGLGADLRDLRFNALLLQVHRLDLSGAPAGTYTLYLGMYDPRTEARLVTSDFAPDVQLGNVTVP